MEQIIQEFRVIETDDGFRIEIKGEKEHLRKFVMSLNPHHWLHHHKSKGHGSAFGPRMMKFMHGHGPHGFAAGCCAEEDAEH